MLILKFIYSILENSDTETLYKLKDKFLPKKEQEYLVFTQDFYALHNKLPDKATFENKFKVTLPKNNEPADFWYDELYTAFQNSIIEKAVIESAKNKGGAIKIFQQAITDFNTDGKVEVYTYADGNKRLKAYNERKLNKGITYLSTGLTELDGMSLGYKKADLWTIGGRESIGKAEPLSNKILTQNRGLISFGELTKKDKVFGSDGKPQSITGIYPQGKRPVYKVSFADGTNVLCDENHLWASENRYDRDRKTGFVTRSTKTLLEDLTRVPKSYYKIPNTPTIEFSAEEKLPIHPYIIGAILGDGCVVGHDTVLTSGDPEILDRLKDLWGNCSDATGKRPTDSPQIRFKGIDKLINSLGMRGKNSFTKEIPEIYLTASISDRIELLRGLMDTDGYRVKGNRIAEFSVRSEKLAKGVVRLVRQLGGIALYSDTKIVKEKPVYVVRASFVKDNFINPFFCKRKASSFKPRANNSCFGKIIRSIEYSHEEECQCISVSNPDKLYLTGEDGVVTHNTWQLLKMADALDNWMIQQSMNRPILIISGEMTAEELEERLDSIRCQISYQRLTNGTLIAGEERKFNRYLQSFESNIIIIDSFDGIADVEFFITLYRPACIFIDGSHLLSASYDWKDIALVTASMKRITRNNKIPIINTTHLKAERGNSAKGGDLDDFAYTKGYTRDSDIVGVMYASDIMELDNKVGIDWVKVRRGNRTRTVWQSDHENGKTVLVENLTGKDLASAKIGDDGSAKGSYAKKQTEIY